MCQFSPAAGRRAAAVSDWRGGDRCLSDRRGVAVDDSARGMVVLAGAQGGGVERFG